MTERFTLKVSRKNNEVKIIDNHNDNLTLFSVSYVVFDDTLLVRNQLKPVVDLLNEQHETIQKLNQQLRIFSDGLKSEIRETKEVFKYLDKKDDLKLELKVEK